MKIREDGVLESSKHFFCSPSPQARQLLFYITSTGHFFCESPYEVRRDDFRSYLLLYMKAGQLNVETPAGSCSVRPGDVLLIDCHSWHRYYAVSPCEFLFAHFNGAMARAFYEAIDQKHGSRIASRREWKIEENLLYTLELLQEHLRPSETDISLRLSSMLCALLDARPNDGQETGNSIQEAVRYIHEHLSNPMTAAEVAEAAGLSLYHFTRRFKVEKGMSPYQYILLLRMDRAKQLLHASTTPIGTISRQVGFSSVSSFIYAFTRHVGMSPGKFRRVSI